MNRIFKILFMFLKSKYVFKLPKGKKILVFDDTSFGDIEHIFKDLDYLVLQSRLQKIDKIYLTADLLFNVFKNYRGNFLTAYIISVIQAIKPKVVFTYIDNSLKFSEVAKVLSKKTQFVALQNGTRYEIKENNYIFKKKLSKRNLNSYFFVPYLLCFGKSEVSLFRKYNIKVKKFKTVGFIRLENYLDYYKKKLKKKTTKKYDICLLSDVGAWNKNLNSEKLKSKFALLAKYCIRFSTKFNKKFIFVFKRPFSDEGFDEEQNLYKKFLTLNEYKYLRKRSKFKKEKDKFGSYQIMRESKVVVGTMSTLLRENIAIGGKTLACNTTGNEIYNFPIRGKFFIKCKTYDEFEKNTLKLLSFSDKKYQKYVNRKTLISNFNTSEIVKKELKNLINS
tara:strand:+ start:313 stop:1488 length:1176 start_codon:yes stop_codon:yes gene_type:complete